MTIRYVTTADSVAASDDIIVASGGFYTIDLPVPTGWADGLKVTIKNLDANAGKRLTGALPSDVIPRLYPGQELEIVSAGGQWVSLRTPGRFKISSACCTIFVADAAHGGLATNDGLDPSRPVCSNAMAAAMIQQELDCNWMTPIAALIAGSVFHDDPFNASTQPVGSNLIQLSVYGGGQAVIMCADVPAITVGDNGEVNIKIEHYGPTNSLFLAGNMNNHASMASGVYQHNNGLFDQSGTVVILGSGPNCSAYFFDGPTPGAAIADGFIVAGTFGDIFRMDEGGGRFTLSGPITTVPWNGANCFATRMIGLYGTNELILGCLFGGGYASLGPSIVSGNSVLVTNGITVIGGNGPVTAQGGVISATK